MHFLKITSVGFAVALSLLFQTCSTNDSGLLMQSPNGRYEARLDETSKPPNALPGEFYVKQVKLTALKDGKVVLVEPQFYAEDQYEPTFLQAYPSREWVSDSVLRLGDSTKSFHDELSFSNASQEPIDLLIVKYGKYERFVIFDLNPGAKVQLQASPQLDKEAAASEVHYTAYQNKHSFSGSAGQFRARTIEEGPQKLSVDIKKAN